MEQPLCFKYAPSEIKKATLNTKKMQRVPTIIMFVPRPQGWPKLFLYAFGNETLPKVLKLNGAHEGYWGVVVMEPATAIMQHSTERLILWILSLCLTSDRGDCPGQKAD